MKYNLSLKINAPLEKIIGLYTLPENNYEWMEGLKSIEPLSGEPGKEGSVSKLTFDYKNRNFVMEETILKNNLPEEYTCQYNTKGVFNIVKTSFTPDGDSACICHTDNEFQFKGMMSLMAPLMKGAFKKQSLKYMNDFKSFAERKIGRQTA